MNKDVVPSKTVFLAEMSLLLKSVRSVAKGKVIERHLAQTRRLIGRLIKHLNSFDDKLKDLEAHDKLSNFEIQELMSTYNQTERLASSLLKKRDDTANAVISKV